MTDEVTAPNQPKKSTPGAPGNRGPKKSAAGPNQGAARPSSRSGPKKPSSDPLAAAAESGSDTNKKDTKKPEQRNRNISGGAGRGSTHRKGPSRQGNNPRETGNSSPAPPSGAESSEAMSSLQRVIADLKTTSPPTQQSPLTANSLSASMHAPAPQPSNLTPNAPVFQPGGANNPFGGMSPADAARHRKAASLGAAALSGNFGSFSPHLGAMIEDAEDGSGNAPYEDGEIQENYYHQQQQQQPGHQARSQSQSFMAPRFAALAAQQEQGDNMGSTGRPQLAPNFMFGARARGASGPMAPPINEDDLNFQFPQQQQGLPNFAPEPPMHQAQNHRKNESVEIGGIMAEQVTDENISWVYWLTCVAIQIALQNQIEALQQQQQALYQQQLASNQVLSFQTPGLAPSRPQAHRRVQSTVPGMVGGGGGGMNFGSPQTAMGQFGALGNLGLGLDGQPQGVPRGHGRRHSVNVVKTPGQGSVSYGNGQQDGFDDGFTPASFNAHSRQASRQDSSWRISKLNLPSKLPMSDRPPA